MFAQLEMNYAQAEITVQTLQKARKSANSQVRYWKNQIQKQQNHVFDFVRRDDSDYYWTNLEENVEIFERLNEVLSLFGFDYITISDADEFVPEPEKEEEDA